jgi:hypothetical protein
MCFGCFVVASSVRIETPMKQACVIHRRRRLQCPRPILEEYWTRGPISQRSAWKMPRRPTNSDTWQATLFFASPVSTTIDCRQPYDSRYHPFGAVMRNSRLGIPLEPPHGQAQILPCVLSLFRMLLRFLLVVVCAFLAYIFYYRG